MIKINITRVPLKYFYYFQWLILGLYLIKSNNKIEVTLRPKKLHERFFLRFYSIYLGLRKYSKWFRKREENTYCLEGEVISSGRKVIFCYDIADCPYFFDTEYLKKVDLYFKAQCPTKIEREGFPLTQSIRIPYNEFVFLNKEKIKPSMLGPSCRSNNMFSFKKLKKGLESIIYRGGDKEKLLMCYFGNSKGPKPTYSKEPDLYNCESDILGYFGNKIAHPNEKRAIVARTIAELGDEFDGRLINDGHFGTDSKPSNAHLYIPLAEFAAHISKFKYNMNISGNRLSIPNKFIYSFAVGTAIFTDKLQVKWYKPFGKELVETIEMGYLKNELVNWESFIQSIKNLPDVGSNEVLREFYDKWYPDIFARYIVNTCLEKLKEESI